MNLLQQDTRRKKEMPIKLLTQIAESAINEQAART